VDKLGAPGPLKWIVRRSDAGLMVVEVIIGGFQDRRGVDLK